MKIFILTLLFSANICFSNYSSPGTGVSWNLDSLVNNSSGNVTFSGGIYFVNDTITFSAGDTLKILNNSELRFGTSVFMDFFGVMIIDPTDSVKITAQDTVTKFLGLKFEDQSDGSRLRKLIFEYGNSIRMLDCDLLIDSCIIRYNTLNSSFASGAVSLFRSNSVISNCRIFRNRRSAITSGANIPSSPLILNNIIYENNTENANVPQINFGATGTGQMVIRGNVITGLFNNSGGIAFLPIGSIADLVIENNIIRQNRYGIAILGGPANVYINNNIIDSNNIQGSPSLGGSGINFSGSSNLISTVTRNKIRGNLWGITIQNTAKPNMGDLTSPDTADIGLNEIYGNGNSGKIFDLFNNTPDSIKAENNYWGTDNLDSVEAHIFHKPDSSALGYVDFIPIRITTHISQNQVKLSDLNFELYDAYPNPFNPETTIKFRIPENGSASEVYSMKIYNIGGRLMSVLFNKRFQAGNYSLRFNAADLPSGIYIYTLSSGVKNISKKIVLLK
ncbi:MAG: T9SS type A sorting domain-containing protein [Bacteroidetes bacterium]|nr:T9SS type A sorting domain-containing protein [Bacteroidota bacterium]